MKKITSVIFDLDQTLVESSAAEIFRHERRWQDVYQLIPKFRIFPGIYSVMRFLNEMDIPIAIVTSSPGIYCAKVLSSFNLNTDVLICYHDTKLHKPEPDPILLALERLGVDASGSISVGDQINDIIASYRAGVFPVHANWGPIDIRTKIGNMSYLDFKSVDTFLYWLKYNIYI